MKKLFVLLMLSLLLFMNSSEAGKTIPLDFEEKESYIIPLFLKDRVIFEFDNDNHSIILDEIKDTRLEFDLFIYLERNKAIKEGEKRDPPDYVFTDTKSLLKFDLNRDDVFDFVLDVYDYDSKKALIEIKKIEEEKDSIIPVVNKNPDNPDWDKRFIWWIISFVLIILAIIITIIINKLVRESKWSYH